MSNGQVLAFQWLGLFVAACLCALVIERIVNRKRVNRRRKGFLVSPDPKCIVGESWRAHTQQGHRY